MDGDRLLSKNEYIALELAKAYLCNGTRHLMARNIVDCYDLILIELNERDKEDQREGVTS